MKLKKLLIVLSFSLTNIRSAVHLDEEQKFYEKQYEEYEQKYISTIESYNKHIMNANSTLNNFPPGLVPVISSYICPTLMPKDEWIKKGKELLKATKEGNIENVRKILIESNDFIDIKDKNYKSRTALMIASMNNNVDIVKILLFHGAAINIKCPLNVTALMYASFNGNASIVELLLNCDADVNVKDLWGETACSMAYSYDHKQIIELFAKKSSNNNFTCCIIS